MTNEARSIIPRPDNLTIDAVNAAFKDGGIDAHLTDHGDGNLIMAGKDKAAADTLLSAWMEEQECVVTYYNHEDRG
ncbi:hypothetical protein [Asaia astilbis]|uniref:hypothetical protein n=1 Tax=Asaia astilbis TaxID=610244 RepID=UPI00046F6F5E|nr:hypothetical protein [Asaia astilbis]